MEHIRPIPDRLALEDGDFHVLDFDADQQKVDFANNHILQMVSDGDKNTNNVMELVGLPGLVVFKLNVQTILDAHLHLYAGVIVGICGQCVDSKLKNGNFNRLLRTEKPPSRGQCPSGVGIW